MHIDLLVTWPKTKPLSSYLETLMWAEMGGDTINYRVSRLPTKQADRCYVVYDGAIVGWSQVVGYSVRKDNEVWDYDRQSYWVMGNYIVREPKWFPVEKPVAYKSFQGWRYFDRNTLLVVNTVSHETKEGCV